MKTMSVDLWFDANAEEAVDFYTSIFEDSKVLATTYYGKDMPGPEGSVMYIEFELAGQRYGAVNGGPIFTFSPAISLVVGVDTQEEIDHLWDALSADPAHEQCGWLKDKFGLSWQIVPRVLNELQSSNDPELSARVMQAVSKMKKLDIATIEAAAKP